VTAEKTGWSVDWILRTWGAAVLRPYGLGQAEVNAKKKRGLAGWDDKSLVGMSGCRFVLGWLHLSPAI
jgi:hypothetical protein